MNYFESVRRAWEFMQFMFEEANENESKYSISFDIIEHTVKFIEDERVNTDVLPLMELSWDEKDVYDIVLLAKNSGLYAIHLKSDEKNIFIISNY